MSDMMVKVDVLQLVSQLSREEKEHLLRYLENEFGIFPRPIMEITPPMTEEEARAFADELGKAGPISHYIIEERQEGY